MNNPLKGNRSSDLDENNNDNLSDVKNPIRWGILYIIFGIIGLAVSIYAVKNSFDIVPIFGTVMAGMSTGALSIFIIVYGYRIMKKDW